MSKRLGLAGAAGASARAVAAAAAWTTPLSAQTLGQGGGAEVSLWRVFGALIFCLALAAGAAFALRARLRGSLPSVKGAGRRLRLVESLRLSHQVDLCLVEIDGKEIVVAATPHGANLLERSGGPG
jgi:flagellar biogenesis protein FliO